MIYKLYNYLKAIEVVTPTNTTLLVHDAHRYLDQNVVVNTCETSHNHIKLQIKNEHRTASTLTVKFYNPIEDIKNFINLDGQNVPYTGTEQFDNIIFISSTWGTYIIKADTPCSIHATETSIEITFELDAHCDLETMIHFEKFVPIHSTAHVLDVVLKN